MDKKQAKTKNHGLNLELEKQDRKDSDYIFGAETPINGLAENIKFKEFLPIGETQRGVEDTMDCATRWVVNALECKFTYLYKHVLKGYLRSWLENNGYIVGGRVVFSDAFLAILSGTTRQGNSMIAPLRAMENNGLIPKSMLPLEPWMTWSDYHNKARITQNMIDLGQKFRSLFRLNYQRVLKKDFNEVIYRDLIGVAGHAWPRPINGEYPRTDETINHAFLYFELPAYEIFDNYPESEGDYIKNLASDYNLYDYGYRVIINYMTYEITTSMVRYVYSLRKDVADAFPATNRFFSPTDPSYSIYDWCREYGIYEMPDIFIKNKLDWSLVDSTRRAEAEWLPPIEEVKKNLIDKIIECLKRFFRL